MKDREVVFMSTSNNAHCIRGIKVSHPDHLVQWFKITNFFQKDYNIYISCAKYKNIPLFTYNLKKRSDQTSQWFHNESYKNIYYYDWFIDLDHEKGNPVKDYGTLMITFLSYSMPFKVFCSSLEGIHVIIKHNFSDQLYSNSLENPSAFNNIIRKRTIRLKSRLKLESLCTSGIGVHNKIRKCPYSLVKSMICLPREVKNKHFCHEPYSMDIIKTRAYKHPDDDYLNIYNTSNKIKGSKGINTNCNLFIKRLILDR